MDRKKRTFQRWSALEGGPVPPLQKRARIMNILKSRKALFSLSTDPPGSRAVFRSIYATSNVNSRALSSLYPPFLWPPPPGYETIPLVSAFLLAPRCLSCFSFSRESLTPPALLPPPLSMPRPGERRVRQGPDQSMQDFCVTGSTVRAAALPSKGTKTCREHHEQETTNCCKLRNTKARAHASRYRVLRLSHAFFRLSFWSPRFYASRVLCTRERAHSRLLTHVLAFPYRAILPVLSPKPRCQPSRRAADFAYRNSNRRTKRLVSDEAETTKRAFKYDDTASSACVFQI